MESPTMDKTPHPISRLIPLAAILIAAGLGFVFLRDVLSFEALAANRDALEVFRDQNYLLAAFAFVAAYAVIVGFSLPGATIATLTGGFLFGIFPGVLFNVLGATLGATAIFLAAKNGLGDRLAARMDNAEGRMQRFKSELDRSQWSVLFVIRLVPIIPFFVANLLPALFGVPLHRYVISTFLGIIPGAIVYTSVGAGLGGLLDRGETPDLGVIFEPQIILPLLGLAAFSVLPIIVRNIRNRHYQ